VLAFWHYLRSPDRNALLAGMSEPREHEQFARTSSLLMSSAASSGTTRGASSVPFLATFFRGSLFSQGKIVSGKKMTHSRFRVFYQ